MALGRWLVRVALTVSLGLGGFGEARATLHAGDVAPNFTKTGLDGLTYTLSQYQGKVVVLFVLGYNCPVCLNDGDFFQPEIWQHYQTSRPGEVQVLGPDVWNGMPPQLNSFRINTGATYPLLLEAGLGAGNQNLLVPYGEQDNYVVINRQGVIRYHALDLWPHGNRYHRDDLRACIDSLLGGVADVGVPATAAPELLASPNPFRDVATLTFVNPGAAARARVTVHDVSGRRVATLWDGPAAVGRTSVSWDGRSQGGLGVGPGVFLVRAEIGGRVIVRRLARIR